jgi:hypothetical protein
VNTYRLESIGENHAIGASMLVPLAIARLTDGVSREVDLRVELRGVATRGDSEHHLRLSWAPESVPTQRPALPERAVTEWAACAVACVVVLLYTGLRVRQVTGHGDAFDYWVDDGEWEYGLEVSGTIDEDLEARHRAKVRQLRRNPYGVDGYVVAVGFAARRVIMSYHRFEEGAN